LIVLYEGFSLRGEAIRQPKFPSALVYQHTAFTSG